jgi:hypothetical protein
MTPLAMQFALHGSIALLSGLVGGLFFARAIKQGRSELAWRVVHSGGCAAGAMLLAIAVPSQWTALGPALLMAMATGLIAGSYLLCLGMYIAAIWGTRGISGGGTTANRIVSGLYAVGTVLTICGSGLLVIGLAAQA